MYDSWFLMATGRQTYKLEANAMLLLEAQGLKHQTVQSLLRPADHLYHALQGSCDVQNSGFGHKLLESATEALFVFPNL